MCRLTLEELTMILSEDVVKRNTCVELNFCVDGSELYHDCWLGKMPAPETKQNAVFWFGLVADGSQAYDYPTLPELLEAGVLEGKSLLEILPSITWYSLDGCGVEERLAYYRLDAR